MKKNVNVVVSRFNENIDWVSDIDNYYSVIYNKGLSEIESSIRLPNLGRESHTYLYHIVNNYNNLHDVTIFLQGNPFDHGFMDFFGSFEAFNNYDFVDNFTGFNSIWQVDADSRPHNFAPSCGYIPNINNFIEKTKIKLPASKVFNFHPGAQFAVKKEHIQKISLEDYIKLLNVLSSNGSDPIEGHIMKRLWFHLFNHN